MTNLLENEIAKKQYEQEVGGTGYSVRYMPNISEKTRNIIKEYAPHDGEYNEDGESMFCMIMIEQYFLLEGAEMYKEFDEADAIILAKIKEDYIEI